MHSIRLKPKYSDKGQDVKCVRTLAREELDACLKTMLSGDDNDECKNRYNALKAFLQSPESYELRAKSEQSLANGENVEVIINYGRDNPEFRLQKLHKE